MTESPGCICQLWWVPGKTYFSTYDRDYNGTLGNKLCSRQLLKLFKLFPRKTEKPLVMGMEFGGEKKTTKRQHILCQQKPEFPKISKNIQYCKETTWEGIPHNLKHLFTSNV